MEGASFRFVEFDAPEHFPAEPPALRTGETTSCNLTSGPSPSGKQQGALRRLCGLSVQTTAAQMAIGRHDL